MSRGRLTRGVEFAAGHRYRHPDWSEAENLARFGRYAGDLGHGHNYRCEVTVEGEIDPETGMLVDLERLDEILRKHIVEPFGHAFLNDVPDFDGGRVVPTAENVARVIWKRLAPDLPAGCLLHRVRVQEERNLWADYLGGRP